MELHSADVVDLMAHRHYLSVGAEGCDFKFIRQRIAVHYPRMVTPDVKSGGYSGKDIVIFCQADFRRDTVKHRREIPQTRPETLADGLMPETHPEDRLFGGVALEKLPGVFRPPKVFRVPARL